MSELFRPLELDDSQRLDLLQKLLQDNKCILRMSDRGRGFRLHETTREDAVSSVRKAIDNFYFSEEYLELPTSDSDSVA